MNAVHVQMHVHAAAKVGKQSLSILSICWTTETVSQLINPLLNLRIVSKVRSLCLRVCTPGWIWLALYWVVHGSKRCDANDIEDEIISSVKCLAIKQLASWPLSHSL